MKNTPSTLDNYLRSVIDGLRQAGFGDDEIVAMLEETIGDVYRDNGLDR